MHSGTAQEEITNATAKRVIEFLLHFQADEMPYQRCIPKRMNEFARQTDREVALVNLLYHQRHHYQHIWFDLLQSLHQDGRCRRFRQEIDVTSRTEGIKELRHLTEHVGKRKNRYHRCILRRRQKRQTCFHIAAKRCRIEHHALGIAGRAGRIVDKRKLFVAILRQMELFTRNDTIRSVGAFGLPVHKAGTHLIITLQEGEIAERNYRPLEGKQFTIQSVPYIRTDEKHLALAVLQEFGYIFTREIRQDGHDNALIRRYRQISHCPCHGIAADNGNLISGLNIQGAKQRMKAKHGLRQFAKSIRASFLSVIAQSGFIPRRSELFVQILEIMHYLYR